MTLVATEARKTCTRCGRRQLLTDFARDYSCPGGHRAQCKGCNRIMRADRERPRNQRKPPRPLLFPKDGTARIQLPEGSKAIIDEAVATGVILTTRWWRDTQGYVFGWLSNGQRVMLHRIIVGVPDGVEVDHRDGNPRNNRRSNLRIATRSENAANQCKRSGVTSSAFKGVTWCAKRSRWESQIRVDSRNRWLGYFDDEEAAAYAYDRAAREAWGEFGRYNFPLEGEQGCLTRKEAR